MLVNVWLEIRDNFDWPPVQDEDGNPPDTELQAKNRETLQRATDMDVVTGLFKTRQQGPRTWAIYSLNYVVNTEQELEQAVERFQSENPGFTNVMGAWYGDYGNEFGTTVTFTEVPNPDYNGDTVDPTIPNPDYLDPDIEILEWEVANDHGPHPAPLPPGATQAEIDAWEIAHQAWEADHVIWLAERNVAYEGFMANQDLRETLPNPAYDGRETLTEIGQTGPPLYPIPGSLLGHMPDIVVYDVDGNEISRDDATELTDVNLLFGQAPRIFS